MDELPDPLTPPDCDLRGLPYMPLDIIRLLDSDFMALATDEEFRIGVILWCKAWQQVPAGSLPGDDRILAHLSGSRDRWCDVRDMSLHGFVKCSDGRFYHPVICEKAIEVWPQRREFKQKKSAEAERKARERQIRSEIFEGLKAIGIQPEYSSKTSELRKLASENNVTFGHADKPVTGHAPVTPYKSKCKCNGKCNCKKDSSPSDSSTSDAADDRPSLLSVLADEPDDVQAAFGRWQTVRARIHPKSGKLQLTDTRRKALQRRLKAIGGLDAWEEVLRKVEASPYLRGEVKPWKAEIDWLLEPKNMTKVLEGNYDDHEQRSHGGSDNHRDPRGSDGTVDAVSFAINALGSRGS